MNSTVKDLIAFHSEQLKNWNTLSEAEIALRSVKQRTIKIGEDEINLLFNPRRVASVKADISDEALKKRACFLCAENREPSQKALTLHPDFIALCNPLPIFTPHFTVALTTHSDQVLPAYIEPMLRMSATIGPEFCLFFNGARAGASAPDHLHFQCCQTKDLISNLSSCEEEWSRNGITCSRLPFCGHSYLDFEGTDPVALNRAISGLLSRLDSRREFGQDFFNLACIYNQGSWQIIVIPRARHRPSCYSAENGFLISPGCVELLGTVITVRESDFNAINPSQIATILSEVLLPDSEIRETITWLKRALS